MLGTATIANAAEFRTWTDDRNILNVVMTGEIMPGDSVKLANALGNRRPRFMFLRSPGADFDAGLEIAYYVRDKGFETVIPPDATCASMCGLIWLASDVRWIAPDGHVGFHAVRYTKNGEVAADGMALVGAYLSRLGFSDVAIATLSDENTLWLTNDKAQRLGIVAKTYTKDKPVQKSQALDDDYWRNKWENYCRERGLGGYIEQGHRCEKAVDNRCAHLPGYIPSKNGLCYRP